MKIGVVSCEKYRDAWEPFVKLFRKFWPDCPYDTCILTDYSNQWEIDGVRLSPICQPKSWAQIVAAWAENASIKKHDAVLVLQEDFFLNAPVNQSLIERGVEVLKARDAAMVRLYPCPGGEKDYGDSHFAEIPKGTRYRVSCQASLWEPSVLCWIASHCDTPGEFELDGTELSNRVDRPFLAWKREVTPWPMQYYCSAISRGKWEPAALEFCRQQGVEVDTSMRGVA